ncbi:hypothetical protein GCM10011487_52760 [Steroidobacter agaridevorans]|uniref:CopL family metal-binding regulatory protein n=1 Tax=Steroidobacter agaridevorans TaxID=2695856 RepID=A0A829YL93_9GAMM|nr:CopL family metal-binding regulatory protein [Steroidobacter agaridevorans]GFE83276.1 hypothetical protein GCM10011487_52760 [Steroidobacter agaridevorans]GFE86828.1 hypothetical protein GCM10011488_17820 [Steroidobacter agaridevorans]
MRVVARCRAGLYSRAVRKFCWQRWTLIFLLMARLVVGELGHAMPVAAMAPLQSATSEMAGEPACAEHEAPKAHHSDDSGGEHDCCKTGDCECPCLHVPCAALGAVILNPVSVALLRVPYGAETVPAARPSGLFRPPA